MEKELSRFRRLTLEERKKIEKLINDGISCNKIGAMIGRGKNSIVVEVRRNGGKENYNAIAAQKSADERNEKKTSSYKKAYGGVLEKYAPKVMKYHQEGLSFWQIRREMKINYITLSRLYKNLGLPNPGIYNMMTDLDDKINNLEQQIEILLDLLKDKK